MSKHSHVVPADLRPEVVRTLASFGMTNEAIATATGWSDSQINTDIRAMGGRAAFMDTTVDAAVHYQRAFRAYIRQDFGVWKKIADHVLNALRAWLEFDRIEAGIKVAESILKALADVPQDGTDVQKLWSWCFGAHEEHHRPLTLMTQFVHIVETEEAAVPCSPEEVIALIVTNSANTYRKFVAPWLELEDSEAIMAAYSELDEREQHVVSHRFGLTMSGDVSREPKSYQEIGVLMSLSRERVRQLETRARQRLATALKSNPRLQRFAEARQQPGVQLVVSRALDRELGRRLLSAENRISELETQIIEHGFQPRGSVTGAGRWSEHLYKRFDELELSVRSRSCLENANLEYIYELVERTEAEWLKRKLFGRKAMNEIKEGLHELGLSLGMDLKGFPRPQH